MSRKRERRSASPELGVLLNDALMESLQIGAVFSEPFRARINSIDFHRDADLLVILISVRSGKKCDHR